jgi:[acyl-carrier-protein] S-malonyltransferase
MDNSMKELVLVFPGQGSQYVEMGKDLLNYKSAQSIFNTANNILGFDLTKIMFEGPQEKLQLTEFTQPAILTHSIALYEVLKEILSEKGYSLDDSIKLLMGHSVGEFAALVAAKSLSFEHAVKLVHLRGQYMQEAVPAGQGKMFAAINVPSDLLLEGCKNCSNEIESVMPANYNEPKQTVVSGNSNACIRLGSWLKDNIQGRFRYLELKVSAPFHSKLMMPAQDKLKKQIDNTEFSPLSIPYCANIDSLIYDDQTDVKIIKQNTISQVSNSVLWNQSIQKIANQYQIIEVGPNKILSGLIKKINPELKVSNLHKTKLDNDLIETVFFDTKVES